MLVPGIPNPFFAICCQVHQKTTIPLDKVTNVSVNGNGPCEVINAAMDTCRWAVSESVAAGLRLNFSGVVVWLVVFALALVNLILSPLITLACWPWRQTGVKIGGQAGGVEASLSTPADTGGLKLRELAIDIVNVVRQAQEANAAKLRNAVSGSGK